MSKVHCIKSLAIKDHLHQYFKLCLREVYDVVTLPVVSYNLYFSTAEK